VFQLYMHAMMHAYVYDTVNQSSDQQQHHFIF
jgi:hypothetical protein